MNPCRKFNIAGVLTIFITASSCVSTSTEITGTWNNQRSDKNYNHILVAALTGPATVRSAVEFDLARNLGSKGVNTTRSMDVLPPKFIEDKNKKEELLEEIRSDGVDGVLTISLIDKDTETRYVPGTYDYYAPYPRFGYYGRFWGYYNYWYPRFQIPGYYTEDKVYFIETNLYDAETEELVWSAQSQTYNPASLNAFSEEFARDICKSLVKEDII